MAVITISRQFASNGDEIARELAAQRRCTLVDKHSLDEELHRYGVETGELVRYDEKRPGIWSGLSVDRDHYAHFLRLAILDVARSGNAVILGRGAHAILAGIPDIVAVRIVASDTVRHARVVEHFGASDAQAERMIHHNDRDRSGFHRFFYGVAWDEPTQYAATINTDTVSTATAVAMIGALAERMDTNAVQHHTRDLIGDHWLATRVAGEIRFTHSMPVRFLDVHATAGIVTLSGAVTAGSIAERCAEIARETPGVREVVQEIQVVPTFNEMLI